MNIIVGFILESVKSYQIPYRRTIMLFTLGFFMLSSIIASYSLMVSLLTSSFQLSILFRFALINIVIICLVMFYLALTKTEVLRYHTSSEQLMKYLKKKEVSHGAWFFDFISDGIKEECCEVLVLKKSEAYMALESPNNPFERVKFEYGNNE